jgi:uncharacterized YigZ family protein
VSSCREIDLFLEAVRREDHDASHHCFAYRVLEDGAIRETWDDDGEPRSSAGEPILKALRSEDVVNILAVVTRHFGGAKLGIGGLIRAYGGVTSEALAEATIVRCDLRSEVEILVPSEASGAVMGIIHRFDGRVLDSQYGEQARIVVSLTPSHVLPFAEALREATGGRARWKELQ